jgi:hypothetical protein
MIKRIALCIVATLVLLLPAAPTVHAASCKGASHAITLSAGAASPRSGTTATGITFSVHYASNAGCAPSSVTVEIAGVGAFPLDSDGTDYAGGETFIRTMTLPVGVHTYTFSATGGSGTGEQSIILTSVNPDNVAITAPTPAPTPPPTPAPTPPPATPQPAAPPPSTPAPAAPAPATPLPAPAGGSASTPPTAAPDGAPTGSTAPSAPPSSDPAPAAPTPSGEPSDEHDSWVGAPIFTGGSPGGPDKATLIGDGGGSGMGLVLSVAATLGMLLLAVVLARRRSHDEPAAAGMAASAASSQAAIPAIPVSVPLADDGPVAAVRPLPPMRELIPPVDPSLLDEDDPSQPAAGAGRPDEEGIPRWLRPSVREARFANDRDHRRSNWG